MIDVGYPLHPAMGWFAEEEEVSLPFIFLIPGLGALVGCPLVAGDFENVDCRFGSLTCPVGPTVLAVGTSARVALVGSVPVDL